MVAAVTVVDLEKRYGDVEAVGGISFEVAVGECVAMLGPNGAGKTTTVEILEGFRARDEGRVDVLGFDPVRPGRELRERVGIVLQQGGMYQVLTVREILTLYHGLYPRPRPIAEVLALVELEEKADARVRTLSGGQQRRLDLALGIIGDPDLLFLDEPTTGFDPSARRRAWDLVQRLRDLGKTILLTTHYMDEAQHLADRVIVLAGGRIVAEGPPDTIGGRDLGATVVAFRLPDGVDPSELPPGLPADDDPRPATVALHTAEPTEVLHRLTGWALERGIDLEGLTVARPSLEDVYLELTQPADADE
ncbi:MAG: ABC transporter ATP-binding protein [Acidimicrobiales bacterium]